MHYKLNLLAFLFSFLIGISFNTTSYKQINYTEQLAPLPNLHQTQSKNFVIGQGYIGFSPATSCTYYKVNLQDFASNSQKPLLKFSVSESKRFRVKKDLD